ncbi:MAG: hypothetical protein GC192_18865 [Bacteroidetes bacterium]|nr:hypothetical protein [Bacteroidota bacterium]
MLTKINLQGDLEFVKSIKHPDRLYSNDYCNLLQGDDGFMYEVALVGDTISRALLIKYSQQGDTILTREYHSVLYPDLQYLVPRTILQRPNKGFAILFGHESIAGPLDFDISMLLLDSNYNEELFKVYASTNWQETATSLIMDNDGGYIIGGNRENTNIVSNNFVYKTLIVKTDEDGNMEWQWLSPPGANQLWGEAEAMLKTSDGGLVVASRRGTEQTVGGMGLIYWDANVFKLDADRNMVWSTPLRGFEPGPLTQLVDMVEATDGNGYVVTGYTADNVSGPSPGFGCWLAKVSPEGDSLWARYYSWIDDVKLNPQPWTMTTTTDGGYIVAGTTLKVGQHIPGWVLKVDSFGCLVPDCHLPNPTIENEKPEIGLSIYPNPTSDYLNFLVNAPKPASGATIRIINSEGSLVKEFKTDSFDQTFIVPVWGWASGGYWLQYCIGSEPIISKQFQITK